jgi:hypothetical protein
MPKIPLNKYIFQPNFYFPLFLTSTCVVNLGDTGSLCGQETSKTSGVLTTLGMIKF